MGRKITLTIIAYCFLISTIPSRAFAEEPPAGRPVSGPRKQIATIIFAGLAGAVLGLSTLSFYSRPQDKLPNIAVGAAVGVIIGTGYTTYQTAVEPHRRYAHRHHESSLKNLPNLLDERDRFSTRDTPMELSYTFTF